MINIVKPGTLVVLCGPAGSGKSTFCRKYFDPSEIVSSDSLRVQILGMRPWTPEFTYSPYRAADLNAVFSVMENIAKIRLNAGLTTVIDSTNLSQGDRTYWFKLAQLYDRPTLCVFFEQTQEYLLSVNSTRETPVPEKVLISQQKAFDLVCKYPTAKHTDEFLFPLNVLPHNNVDVIGDLHGLLTEFKCLAKKLGWDTETWTHPQPNRLFLFLGDIVDRGLHSVELLDLVMLLVKQGKALFICGNHDKKLLKFLLAAKEKEVKDWTSLANARTGCEILRTKSEEQINSIITFLRNSVWEYTCVDDECAFTHGDIKQFDKQILSGAAIYGESVYGEKSTCDEEYQRSYEQGVSTHTLIHGHLPQSSIQNNVFSLDDQAFDGGHLMGLPLDQLKNHPDWNGPNHRAAFEDVVVREKSYFEFTKIVSPSSFSLIRGLKQLKKDGLVFTQEDSTGLLEVYKYTPKVHWDRLWMTSPWLKKSRGLVLDKSGEIVAHSFDKCFNYLEEGAGNDVPEDTPVYQIEKLNGFLGVVSKHPFRPGPLINTSGAIDGPYTQILRKHLSSSQISKIMQFFAKNKMSLLFEVLDPEENEAHIVRYSPDDFGLYLIGARGLTLDSELLSEEELDKVAVALGFKRPVWTVKPFQEAVSTARASKGEGFMLRHLNGDVICKLKSESYLATKLISRLSDKKIEHMYKNPSDFVRTKGIEEEFVSLINYIVKNVQKAEFLVMPENVRNQLVVDTLKTLTNQKVF